MFWMGGRSRVRFLTIIYQNETVHFAFCDDLGAIKYIKTKFLNPSD